MRLTHAVTLCMWGSLTFTLRVWAHSHVSWGLLTVMLQVYKAHIYIVSVRLTRTWVTAWGSLEFSSWVWSSFRLVLQQLLWRSQLHYGCETHVCECDTLELPLWGSVAITLQVWGSLTVTFRIVWMVSQHCKTELLFQAKYLITTFAWLFLIGKFHECSAEKEFM